MSLDLKLKFAQGYRDDDFLAAIHFLNSENVKCALIMTEQRLLISPQSMHLEIEEKIPEVSSSEIYMVELREVKPLAGSVNQDDCPPQVEYDQTP